MDDLFTICKRTSLIYKVRRARNPSTFLITTFPCASFYNNYPQLIASLQSIVSVSMYQSPKPYPTEISLSSIDASGEEENTFASQSAASGSVSTNISDVVDNKTTDGSCSPNQNGESKLLDTSPKAKASSKLGFDLDFLTLLKNAEPANLAAIHSVTMTNLTSKISSSSISDTFDQANVSTSTPVKESPLSTPCKQKEAPSTQKEATANRPSSTHTERDRPSACVFVAALHPGHTDDQLGVAVEAHFKQFGMIVRVKVLKDTRHRPYAFVQYHNDADATKAIEGSKDTSICGRPIRCERARVNRSLHVSVTDSLSSEQIKEALQKYGEIESVESVPEVDKGYFVKFVYREDAINAYSSMQRNRSSGWKVSWTQNADSLNQIDRKSVFVGHLPASTTENQLHERFQLYGEVTECSIVKARDQTFAFITFKKEASVSRAVNAENHALFNGVTITAQYRYLNYNSTMKAKKNSGIMLAPVPVDDVAFTGNHQRTQSRYRKSRSAAVGLSPNSNSFNSSWRSGNMAKEVRIKRPSGYGPNDKENGDEWTTVTRSSHSQFGHKNRSTSRNGSAVCPHGCVSHISHHPRVHFTEPYDCTW